MDENYCKYETDIYLKLAEKVRVKPTSEPQAKGLLLRIKDKLKIKVDK